VVTPAGPRALLPSELGALGRSQGEGGAGTLQSKSDSPLFLNPAKGSRPDAITADDFCFKTVFDVTDGGRRISRGSQKR
jgi:hypothetical protein